MNDGQFFPALRWYPTWRHAPN